MGSSASAHAAMCYTSACSARWSWKGTSLGNIVCRGVSFSSIARLHGERAPTPLARSARKMLHALVVPCIIQRGRCKRFHLGRERSDQRCYTDVPQQRSHGRAASPLQRSGGANSLQCEALAFERWALALAASLPLPLEYLPLP